MSNRRYFWLKLNENFFEDDTIEWIEEQEGGEKYVLFYLKLCLKSLKEDGNLIRYVGEKLIPYDVKTLSKLTNTDKDTVAVALKAFEEIGLVERKNTGEIFMKQINEMIGSETDSARKMRKKRARDRVLGEGKKEIESQCDYNVIESDLDVMKCDTEIEKEIEKDKEVDEERSNSDDSFRKVVQAFEQNGFGTINMSTKEMLVDLIDEYTSDWVLDAILLSVKRNARNLGYVEGILKSWIANGKDDNIEQPIKKENKWDVDAT